MKTINKQPKIRFKGYTDEWEQRKLGEIIQVNSGKDYKHLNKGEIPVYGTGGYMLSVDEALSYKDAIGLGRKGTINKPYLLKAPFWTVDTLFYSIPINNNDLLFINTLFQNINWKKYDESTGVPSLSKNSIIRIEKKVPNIEEQEKIGLFFLKLSDTIDLHQRKLEALEKTKKSFLQKMFPKKDETKPEIRFAGFTDDWEQRKAIKIFTSISKKKYPELPVLSASQEKGMILRDKIGIDIKYDKKSLNTYKKVSPGQFVIHLRSFQGGFAYSEIEGITSPAYTVIDFKDKELYYPLFWRFVLSSTTFIKKLETVTYGIRDGRSISFTDFSSLKFVVPGYEEQQKIGNFFKQLDDTIALHQRQLEVLKNMKTSFLQKMYI